jgi:hypothetical protein
MTCDGTCSSTTTCPPCRRSARAEQLRLHWWNVALGYARRFHAATTTHDKTLAFRALRGVPRRTGEMALFEEARP